MQFRHVENQSTYELTESLLLQGDEFKALDYIPKGLIQCV